MYKCIHFHLTSSSLVLISAARHCPPSCPIGVQINTERANAALLSWFPAQDSRKNPPSGYIIERQEVGSQEWLQCLTTDSATSVEILGDSVPCEADYRFRICSVNKYGRSGNVEFPRAVHLGKLLFKAIHCIHKKALTNFIPNSSSSCQNPSTSTRRFSARGPGCLLYH